MDRNSRARAIPVMLIGVMLGMVMLTPVSAHHGSKHTKKMVKAVKKRVAATETTAFRRAGPFNVAFEDYTFAEAVCPPGMEATGGGASVDGPAVTGISAPTDGTGAFVATEGNAGAGHTAWGVVVGDTFSSGPHDFYVYVICQKAKKVDTNYPAGGPTYPRAPGREWSGSFTPGS